MAKYRIAAGQPDQRKGLVATAAIFTGESILEERPLICSQFLWNAEYKYAACEYCLTPLETAEENVRRLTGDDTIRLPFTEQCCPTNKSTHVSCSCGARFCSGECRLQAWNLYHRTLCTQEPSNGPQLGNLLSKFTEYWKRVHYPPETASIMLLVKLLASIRQSPNAAELIGKVGEFTCAMGNSEEMIRKLLGEKFSEHVVAIRQMVGQIVYDASLEQFFTDQGFALLFSLIIRHGQAIGTNPFTKWAENCERYVANDPLECERIEKLVEQLFERIDRTTGMQFSNSEGSGLFPVKAIRPIEQGEEITISYLDECMLTSSRHSRVKYLRENYSFTCRCTKCESQLGEPDVTSEEEDEDVSDGDHVSDDEMNCD